MRAPLVICILLAIFYIASCKAKENYRIIIKNEPNALLTTDWNFYSFEQNYPDTWPNKFFLPEGVYLNNRGEIKKVSSKNGRQKALVATGIRKGIEESFLAKLTEMCDEKSIRLSLGPKAENMKLGNIYHGTLSSDNDKYPITIQSYDLKSKKGYVLFKITLRIS